jgi:osmotically-inducible protein OsmY
MKAAKPRWWVRTAALLLIATTLGGCVELVVGGAVMGTMAASDRRTFGAQADDKLMALKGEDRVGDRFGSRARVNVTSYNRRLLLTGQVPDAAAKEEAERIASQVENTRAVINELEIGTPSSIGTRSSDTLITGKVKASFVDAKDIFANSFKVVTESGTVYLLGLVTEKEGARAADIARNVAGVQKVVKVFEYITDEELQRLSNLKPATQTPQK